MIIFNIALPINFWMLIFLYKVLHPLMFGHFSGYRWAKNIMNLIGQFFYFKKFWFFRFGDFSSVDTTDQVRLGVCMREFCAFAQTFSALFFQIYFFTHKYRDLGFFCVLLLPFLILLWEIKWRDFLLVLILHFVSCGHIRIA